MSAGRTAALAASLLLAGILRAETLPPPGETDQRVRTVEYHAREVYRLHGYVGYAIHLTFEPGEVFEGLSGGDLEGIAWDSDRNHLFLKPRTPRINTNLTLLTSRRAYELHYSASVMGSAIQAANVTYALHFTYPEGDRHKAASAAAVDALDSAQAMVRNRDYWFCGATSLKPISVWDDGTRTWIRFADHAEWPAIFALSEDGEESLVNYSVSGSDVIVHRLASRFMLRRGRLVGCIENRSFEGQGGRIASGTASPQVERTVRGAP